MGQGSGWGHAARQGGLGNDSARWWAVLHVRTADVVCLAFGGVCASESERMGVVVSASFGASARGAAVEAGCALQGEAAGRSTVRQGRAGQAGHAGAGQARAVQCWKWAKVSAASREGSVRAARR